MDSTSPRVIVLAGGRGTRLQPLVRALYGRELPKQFASLDSERTLLQSTLERATVLAPSARVQVVVAEEWHGVARTQLGGYGPIDIIGQPADRGTGPGILLPLAKVMATDPEALVVVLPSDHFVEDVASFNRSLCRACAVAHEEQTIVLLGSVPDSSDPDYGWIVRESHGCRTSDRIHHFEEKPCGERARELRQSGALWNTFVMAGPARTFWATARAWMGPQWLRFEQYRGAVGTAWEAEVLRAAYATMEPADYSRSVLQHEPELRVLPLGPCGWSDWGTPRRVFASLEKCGRQGRLVGRLRSTGGGPAGRGRVRATAPKDRSTSRFDAPHESSDKREGAALVASRRVR